MDSAFLNTSDFFIFAIKSQSQDFSYLCMRRHSAVQYSQSSPDGSNRLCWLAVNSWSLNGRISNNSDSGPLDHAYHPVKVLSPSSTLSLDSSWPYCGSLHVQQTPKPEAQLPALVPPLFEHSSLKNKKKSCPIFIRTLMIFQTLSTQLNRSLSARADT